MIHLGFTGPRIGMTSAQGEALWRLIQYLDFYAHHGDCSGADAEFDGIVRLVSGCRGVVIHPSNASSRAHCRVELPRDALRDVKPPLDRNQDIVDESDRMIATPSQTAPQPRSGTWATIRRALASGKPLAILLPNGGVVFEGAPWT